MIELKVQDLTDILNQSDLRLDEVDMSDTVDSDTPLMATLDVARFAMQVVYLGILPNGYVGTQQAD
ncbi:hypothetical protein [Actinophytocola sp.]|uniref:hypothetical protein n=1 Tax=Actinophytocola sp. TaxID=1872138 RepID=UPI00389ADEAE